MNWLIALQTYYCYKKDFAENTFYKNANTFYRKFIGTSWKICLRFP